MYDLTNYMITTTNKTIQHDPNKMNLKLNSGISVHEILHKCFLNNLPYFFTERGDKYLFSMDIRKPQEVIFYDKEKHKFFSRNVNGLQELAEIIKYSADIMKLTQFYLFINLANSVYRGSVKN